MKARTKSYRTGFPPAYSSSSINLGDITTWQDSFGPLLRSSQSLQSPRLKKRNPKWLGLIADLGDFDKNGYSDILWRKGTGENSIWFFDKGGVISKPGIERLPTDWSVHGIADFNKDGHADILWRRASGEFGIWFMTGTKVSAPSIPGSNTLGLHWQVGGVGDFDGDNYADILWCNVITGQNSIWFMNGPRVRSTPGIDPLSLDWRIDGVGDFNKDGRADLLWRRASGEFGIWFIDGTKVTAPAISGSNTLGLHWQVGGVGDFDGDSYADVLWCNVLTGENSIWFMSGVTVRSTPGIKATPKGESFQGQGDFNGDRRPDLLFRQDNGTFVSWLSEGSEACVAAKWTAIAECIPATLELLTIPTGFVGWGLAITGGIACLNGTANAVQTCGGYQSPPATTTPAGETRANADGRNTGGHESHDRPLGTSGKSPGGSASGSNGQSSGSISSGGVRLK